MNKNERLKAHRESIQKLIDAYKEEGGNTGDLSDGYHTFNELYHHRAVLFAMICNQNKDKAWKSLKHFDGTMYDGMFIVGVESPYGQITYHYDVEPDWKLFNIKEVENAPQWDGSTPNDCIDRMEKWSKDI